MIIGLIKTGFICSKCGCGRKRNKSMEVVMQLEARIESLFEKLEEANKRWEQAQSEEASKVDRAVLDLDVIKQLVAGILENSGLDPEKYKKIKKGYEEREAEEGLEKSGKFFMDRVIREWRAGV